MRRDLLLHGHEVAVDRVVRGQVLVDGRPHAVDEGRVGDRDTHTVGSRLDERRHYTGHHDGAVRLALHEGHRGVHLEGVAWGEWTNEAAHGAVA